LSVDSNLGTKRRKRNPKSTNKPRKLAAPGSTEAKKRSGKHQADADAPQAAVRQKALTVTPLRIPFGNKEVALRLGARYGSTGWYAPPGVDLTAFDERGWL
jgi:DNA topoisomerase-3